jgi:hypothetical protein
VKKAAGRVAEAGVHLHLPVGVTVGLESIF